MRRGEAVRQRSEARSPRSSYSPGDACATQGAGDDVAVAANLASARLRIFREDEGDLLVHRCNGLTQNGYGFGPEAARTRRAASAMIAGTLRSAGGSLGASTRSRAA